MQGVGTCSANRMTRLVVQGEDFPSTRSLVHLCNGDTLGRQSIRRGDGRLRLWRETREGVEGRLRFWRETREGVEGMFCAASILCRRTHDLVGQRADDQNSPKSRWNGVGKFQSGLSATM